MLRNDPIQSTNRPADSEVRSVIQYQNAFEQYQTMKAVKYPLEACKMYALDAMSKVMVRKRVRMFNKLRATSTFRKTNTL